MVKQLSIYELHLQCHTVHEGAFRAAQTDARQKIANECADDTWAIKFIRII